mgnify:CR=1 FL=1
MITFAGSDPGDLNYGYTILSASNTRGKLRIKVLEIGMFSCQINNLTAKPAKPPKSKRRKTIKILYPPFPDQMDSFSTEWEEIFDSHKVVGYTTERFQARGLKGKSIEAVSIMNGLSCSLARKRQIDFEMITASTWKNQVNRYTDLEAIYAMVPDLTPHSIDSCFLAIHGVIRHFKSSWDDVPYGEVIKQLQCFETVK